MRGIVSGGTTGEYYALSDAERVDVMRHTHEVAAGRAQLVAGCNSGSTRAGDRRSPAPQRDIGYDALMLAAPPTSLPRQHELAAHFVAVAEACGLPTILYNYPARAGVEIGFECLDLVAEHPLIVGLKESSGDFSRFLRPARSLRRPDHDHVRLGRPGRGLLLLGRALVAGRHGERAAPAARRHPQCGQQR